MPDGMHIIRARRIDDRGFSLTELLMAVMILSVAIVPIIKAIGPAVETTAAEERFSVFTNQARATLNRLLTLDFATLSSNQGAQVDLASLFGTTAEANLENFRFKGVVYTPAVAISDASGGEGGLLKLTVTIDQVRLTTLKAEH